MSQKNLEVQEASVLGISYSDPNRMFQSYTKEIQISYLNIFLRRIASCTPPKFQNTKSLWGLFERNTYNDFNGAM